MWDASRGRVLRVPLSGIAQHPPTGGLALSRLRADPRRRFAYGTRDERLLGSHPGSDRESVEKLPGRRKRRLVIDANVRPICAVERHPDRGGNLVVGLLEWWARLTVERRRGRCFRVLLLDETSMGRYHRLCRRPRGTPTARTHQRLLWSRRLASCLYFRGSNGICLPLLTSCGGRWMRRSSRNTSSVRCS